MILVFIVVVSESLSLLTFLGLAVAKLVDEVENEATK